MSRFKFVIAGMAVALAAGFAAPARAAEPPACPPGTTEVGIETVGEVKHRLCRCADGHFARDNQCVPRMPGLDPAVLVSDQHVAFVLRELDRLKSRRTRLEGQLDKIYQLRGSQDRYLQEMGMMREQLAYDCLGDVLSIVGATDVLQRIGLSAADVETASTAIAMVRTALEGVAASRSGPDRDRATDKVVDATSRSISMIARISRPPEASEAISKMIEATAEAAKAKWANDREFNAPSKARILTALDGIARVIGTASPMVGTLRTGISIMGNSYVLLHIQNDKQSIQEALVSSQRAKLAADQRLATTKEMIRFYETEMNRVR